MSAGRRYRSPRRTARRGLPVEGAVPPRRPVAPVARRRGPFLVLALVMVALTAGVAARQIVSAGFFAVRAVQVDGASPLIEDAVRAAAGVEGKQIWQVQPDAVAAAVAGVPGVRQASVRRALPNRVTISVEERMPAAVWRVGDDDLVVDEEGVVLDAPPMGGLPLIHFLDGTPGLKAGDRLDGDAVRLVRELALSLGAAVGQRAVRFEYSSGGGLDIVTDGGVRVRFGDGQNLAYKLELWRAITEQIKKERLTPTEIDLRFGQWAALR